MKRGGSVSEIASKKPKGEGLAPDEHTETCPTCGFDMYPPKPCGVCGRDAKSAQSGTWVPLLFLLGLIIVFLALFSVNDLTRSSDASTQAAAPTLAPETDGQATAQHAASSNPPETAFDITKRTEIPPLTSADAYVSWMLAHMHQEKKYLTARWNRAQIIARTEDLQHTSVLEAFLMTPREYFARDPRRAYESAVLPIGYGQTISGPHMVAKMTDSLNVQPEQKVLEIGTGSGYQSAVLSELCNHVYTIEIVAPLARETDAIYRKWDTDFPEYSNITRKVDDGYFGWPEYAPFDRIIVTCGIDHIPPELLRELAPNGIMVIPIGPPSGQTVLKIVKHVTLDGTITLDREDIYHGRRKAVFVPFTAKGGGRHSESTPPGAN